MNPQDGQIQGSLCHCRCFQLPLLRNLKAVQTTYQRPDIQKERGQLQCRGDGPSSMPLASRTKRVQCLSGLAIRTRIWRSYQKKQHAFLSAVIKFKSWCACADHWSFRSSFVCYFSIPPTLRFHLNIFSFLFSFFLLPNLSLKILWVSIRLCLCQSVCYVFVVSVSNIFLLCCSTWIFFFDSVLL